MKLPATPLDASGIAEYLRQLATSSEGPENEPTLLREGAMPLLLGLGYSPDEIFFEYSIPWLDDFYRVDIAVAPDRHSPPWLLVEVRPHAETEDLARSLDVLSGLGKACGARAVMLLTQRIMSVATASARRGEAHRSLWAMTAESAEELIGDVGRSALGALSNSGRAPFFTIGVRNPSGRFSIDRSQLEQRLVAACGATDSTVKGTSFEELARYILSGLTSVEIRQKNVLTATGELDLVCRFREIDSPGFLWTAADKYFIVECKNWQAPVSAKEIEAFVGKLQKCRSHLGLLFSRNGITGRTGRDAVGNVEAVWRQHGIIILVITEEAIRQVIEGFDFYSMCERLYERVRFSER